MINIVISFIVIIFLLSNQIYAKYNYQIVLDAFYLMRDDSEILYKIEKSVPDNEYTNQDVILKIIANKEIEEVECFKLDETKTTLTKNVSENQESSILLNDLSGNQKEVNYSIKNIDKEPPQIIGVEDGVTYRQPVNIEYTDNTEIKEIKVDKYGNQLIIRCEEDFYDSEFYKGLDVLGNQIYVDVIQHPKDTVNYRFYLNNVLKATTEKSEYTYKGLSTATTYTIKVEAIDNQENILGTVSKTVTTKCFTGIKATKVGDTFKVKITGIDKNASLGFNALWYEGCGTQKYSYPGSNSDYSVDLSFNAYQIDGKKSSGYYYFHLQFFNNFDSKYNQIFCMNIKFDKNYEKINDDIDIDPNCLNQRGNYEITVIDVAGNKTTKKCVISI